MEQGAAAVDAGYSDKKPSQSAYQALQQIQRRMPELLDDLGLTDRAIIEKHLVPLPEAKESKFFPWRKSAKCKLEQIIDRRDVAALGTRCFAVDVLFRLRCDYAPR